MRIRILVVQQDLLSHHPELLHFSFQFSVLCDVRFVDEVQLGLN